MPSLEEVWRVINAHETANGEWCGMPQPIPGLRLHLEDRHPLAPRIGELQTIVDDIPHADPYLRVCSDADVEPMVVVNEWRNDAKGGIVVIYRTASGRTGWYLDPDGPKRNRMRMGPLETFDAWNLDAEFAAMTTLGTLLTGRMFRAYILTGGFLETSKRSKLTYWFRRLRPTVVMTDHPRDYNYFRDVPHEGEVSILCTLCLHPIGYYTNSYCGAMVPTDDVIAHLLMMRSDEHKFWQRANQHHASEPEAGLL